MDIKDKTVIISGASSGIGGRRHRSHTLFPDTTSTGKRKRCVYHANGTTTII